MNSLMRFITFLLWLFDASSKLLEYIQDVVNVILSIQREGSPSKEMDRGLCIVLYTMFSLVPTEINFVSSQAKYMCFLDNIMGAMIK